MFNLLLLKLLVSLRNGGLLFENVHFLRLHYVTCTLRSLPVHPEMLLLSLDLGLSRARPACELLKEDSPSTRQVSAR